MICPRCRSDIPDGSKFCRECGERQRSFCVKCGSEISSDHNVCDNCGNLLLPISGREKTPPHLPGERRNITVLFSDLSGQPSLTEYLDPEETKEFM